MRRYLNMAGAVLARFVVPNLVQVSGLALIATGFFLLAPWLGCLASGALLCVIGRALDGGNN